METTGTRLAWVQHAPEPDGMYFSELGLYTFEISHTVDQGYVLEVWQTRSEDWPLLVWEMDGFTLDEAKAKAERLADQHVPAITQ
jgi:hypothetical protein